MLPSPLADEAAEEQRGFVQVSNSSNKRPTTAEQNLVTHCFLCWLGGVMGSPYCNILFLYDFHGTCHERIVHFFG